MPENSRKIKPLTPISDQMLLDFMEKKRVSPICPLCSNESWHRLVEPAAGTNYLVPPIYESSYMGLEVVVIYCMNCGYVRQHAAHLIRAASEAKNGA